jgi:hypothetical protein
MVTVPAATPVTKPDSFTVAVETFELDHVPLVGLPPVNCRVEPAHTDTALLSVVIVGDGTAFIVSDTAVRVALSQPAFVFAAAYAVIVPTALLLGAFVVFPFVAAVYQTTV